MELKIEIQCDDAAFSPFADTEVVRILKDLSRKIEIHGMPMKEVWPIMSIDGNTVGSVRLDEDD